MSANSVLRSVEAALTVRVPEGAVYAGGERFQLYGVADCEMHLFVEADAARRVRRLYWVQFESYLPTSIGHGYDYSSNRRMDLWNAAAWVQPFVSLTSRPPRAGSDTERVRVILARSGYELPLHMMGVRFVRLLDDPQGSGRGRQELMLIYSEDMAIAGASWGDVTTDGATNARWPQFEAPLIARGADAFAVEMR